jgi:hypothetical protein
MSKKSLHEELRSKYMLAVSHFLAEQGETVLQTGANEFAVPCVDSEGNEEYLVLTFKVPTGSRDGDPYDGYSMHEDYLMKCATKEAKAKERAEAKAKKIARDKAQREAKAKAKAEREGN